MKKINSKLKALEWSKQISHYKSIGIFPDAQWQLTPQSKVWSGRISNPFEILCLSLLPARMKKMQSKMRSFSGHSIIHWFFRCSRAANSKISDGILPKFKPIQAFMLDLVTWKNEEDPFEFESTWEVTTFLPSYVFWDFFRPSRAANSQVPYQILPNF